jgi:hypothetical protein
MSMLSADAGNAAPGHRISHGGIDYEFRHFGAVELARYERERYRAERDKLRELKDDYTPEQYVERLDALRERFERHEFDFLADMAALELPGGVPGKSIHENVLLVMRVMNGRTDEENWRLLLAQPEEVGQIMRLVIEDSFPKLAAGTRGAASPAGRD